MYPTYMPVLKAKKGEFDTFKQLPINIKNEMLPVFELPLLSEKQRTSKNISRLVLQWHLLSRSVLLT
ncbi:beta family protein [Enterobacter soli]|uniref:beta family protein n=2 Tax=Enterobacter soli TaxID=885040 RepID=UPI003F87DF68